MAREFIEKQDSLNQGREKLNRSIDRSYDADTKSDKAIKDSGEALTTSLSVRDELNQVVIDGDSSVEAAQARVGTDGTNYSVLKERLDVEHEKVTAQLTQTYHNVNNFGAIGDGVTDSTQAFKQANELGGFILVPEGVYIITDTIDLKSFFVGRGRKSHIIFKNLGDKTAFTNTKGGYISGLFDLRVQANSWDIADGCLSYGLEITRTTYIKNVKISHFKKSNIFLHHDATSHGPYYSSLENVVSDYSGEHGILIGTGANSVQIINPVTRWNGTQSYGVHPNTLGYYDGVYVGEGEEGNPNDKLPIFTPEGVRILGGDASYNARYGWNITSTMNSHITTDYSELNLQTDEVKVGSRVRTSHIDFAMGKKNSIEVDEELALINPNQITVGGEFLGSGAKDVYGKYINAILKNLKNQLSGGVNSSVYLKSDNLGNIYVEGDGYQPTMTIDLYKLITNVLRLNKIESLGKITFKVGSNASLKLEVNEKGYPVITGEGFNPTVTMDIITDIKELRLGDSHLPTADTSTQTHKIPIKINDKTYYLMASDS